jgi:hypothetical protein
MPPASGPARYLAHPAAPSLSLTDAQAPLVSSPFPNRHRCPTPRALDENLGHAVPRQASFHAGCCPLPSPLPTHNFWSKPPTPMSTGACRSPSGRCNGAPRAPGRKRVRTSPPPDRLAFLCHLPMPVAQRSLRLRPTSLLATRGGVCVAPRVNHPTGPVPTTPPERL